MKVEEVFRSQIQEWYPKFKSLSIKTTIIRPLPESFIRYLLQDSGPLILPESVSGHDALPKRTVPSFPDENDDYRPWSSDEIDESDDDEVERPPSFPELELEVNSAIESLGGSVMPKLNWSAPKDAAWIAANGTLECRSFSEIVLLLKSSDNLVHDLCRAFDSCEDKSDSQPREFVLALRKWYSGMQPEMEFRCFVKNGDICGISQREVTTFYPRLLSMKVELKEKIEEFYEESLIGELGLQDYVFDVYVTRDGRVKLLDFNPWGAFTLPLLFSWEELEEEKFGNNGELGFEFRVVMSRRSVRPGLKTAMPFDYIDTSAGSGWDQFLRKADEELKRQYESADGESNSQI